ncbi:hypothetical protein [Mycobacterium paragordonae]|uniref:Uncharacterized protein n=1 Tax=Mycobacterium paragordonae TaxID=1389713 RepID=A0ABQ1C0E2_9MYCO|nr:hypothetical protein [Mycobacterium paragordonae]GFG77903.1 hypothetical protein MPRG_11790 [Mycobacterium paragordonae]
MQNSIDVIDSGEGAAIRIIYRPNGVTLYQGPGHVILSHAEVTELIAKLSGAEQRARPRKRYRMA